MLHMRELHGIVRFGCSEEQLKRQAIMFDRFHVVHNHFGFGPPNDAQNAAEWDALETLGIAERVPERFGNEVTMAELFAFSGYRSDASALDSYIRYAASKYTDPEWDVVPICQFPLPSGPDPAPEMLASLQRARPGFGTTQTAKKKSIESVLEVALTALPAPDESCAWEDILNFKADLHDKQWGFRRFLRSLSLKQPTESEVRDEIEWMVNEYAKAMHVHNLKASPAFFEAYVIPGLEFIEDIVKFKWSKIAKGVVAVKKRKVELLEAEMKAPGKECAYVFEARKRFGGS
jgi:hypothetical protein